MNFYFKRIILFLPPIIGAVAQSVEQRTENPCVGGSIPPHTTKKVKRLRVKNVVAFFMWSGERSGDFKFSSKVS